MSEGDRKPSICSLCKLKKVMIYSSQLQSTYMLNLLFFFPLCRPAQGQVRVPFSAAHPRQHAVLWHFMMDSLEKGPCTFKMNWAPSMGQHSDSVTVQLGENGALDYLWQPSSTCLLACFIALSVTSLFQSPFTCRPRQRGDSCGFFKALQQLQTPHGIASVQVLQQCLC